MVEPRIQYAKTEDGVSIAYSELGDGLPFVILTLPSHIAAEWRALEATYTQLASEVQVVRLDHRGFGLSDRTFDDASLDAYASDLEAVVDKLDLSRFILYTTSPPTTPIAIAYTARHPERVTRMLLTGYVRTPEIVGQQIEATLNMPGTDWQFVSEALARILQGWGDEETARRMAANFRMSVDLDGFKRFSESFRHWDVSDLLPLLATPALVTDDPRWGVEQARALAAGLLNAQLVTLDAATYTERLAQRNAAVRAFLGAPAQPDEIALPSGTAIILFLDIADSTALTTKLGDTAYRDRERELDGKLRAAIAEAGGTPIEGKVLGDGIMSVYTSARQAIEAAQRCRDIGNDAGLPLHLGIHAGDVVREVASDGRANVHGGAVQMAARVQGVAEPGEILVSDIVRGLARTSAGVAFEDRGEHEMKGIAELQRLFAVRAEGSPKETAS